MRLESIQIKNFGIIREAEITFSKSNPVVGLVGRYESDVDNGRSNRAGKSTFVEAIEYNLFGKARTRSHGKLINRTAKANGEGMHVWCSWQLSDGQVIEIERVRSNDGKGTATVTGYEGSGWNEVNDVVSELIGFTHEEYKNTAYFSQGDIHAFMNSTPKDKRGLLLEWLNQTRWEERANLSKQRASDAGSNVYQLQGTLNALPEPSGDPKELMELAEETRENLGQYQQVVSLLDRQLETLDKKRRELGRQHTLVERKGRLQERIEDVEAILEVAEKNASKKALVDAEVERVQLELDRHRESAAVVWRKLQSQSDRLNTNYHSLKKAYSNITGHGGICPVLKEQCDRIDPQSVKDMQAELDQAKIESDKAKIELQQYVDAEKLVADRLRVQLEKLLLESKSMTTTNTEYYEHQLDQLDAELLEVESEIVDSDLSFEEIEQAYCGASSEQNELYQKIGECEAQIVRYEVEAKRATEYLGRKKRLQEALDAAILDQATWKYCAYMFGDRGIPNEFIKGAFDSLEGDVNYILNRMNAGLTVEFRPYRETKNFEPSCLACGYEFKPRERKCKTCKEPRQRKRVEQLVLAIHDATEKTESDFSLDSGGGQVLISFAVRLALLLFKIRSGNGETVPVVLDEIVGMLDPVNRQAVIDVVLHILTEEYGIQQVFWISHNPDILDMIENGLAVTRIGSHSIVEWM